MPRGAEYVNEPPHSDNAVPDVNPITHGVGGTTEDVQTDKAHKTAPLPDGLKEEVHDRVLSGGGSGNAPGKLEGSGKGGHSVHEGSGQGKGLGGKGEKKVGM